MALVGDIHRTASVVARTDVTCWALTVSAFQEFGNRNLQSGWLVLSEIARLLAARLDRTNGDVLTLFQALVNEIESETLS